MASGNAGVIIVAGNDRGRLGRKFSDSGKDILWRVRRKVGNQLVVDGEIRRQHKEVVDSMRSVQIADESPPKPRLTDSGGEGETKRRKVALEIRHCWELAADRLQCRGQVGSLLRRHDLCDPVQDL